MNKITKMRLFFDIGGLNLLLFKLEDKITGSHNSKYYMYRIFEAAGADDYPRLLKDIWAINNNGESVLNLNNPMTFNEKIQWIKLYDSTPLKTRLADKYLAREWLAKKIGEEYLVPLLGVWDSFDEINFQSLPESFVLKCNHGSGWNIIVTNKAQFDIQSAKLHFDEWMKLNYAYINLEMHYRDIPRKIIAEKYLDVSDGIKDYRFYCFNGMPFQCWVDLYSGTPDHIRSIFDMNWNKINMRCGWPDGGEKLSKKPKNFEKMKKFSEKLSQPFAFARVDFFEVNEKLYMGEMTFTPMNGMGKFDPPEWDIKLGNQLVLPVRYINDSL